MIKTLYIYYYWFNLSFHSFYLSLINKKGEKRQLVFLCYYYYHYSTFSLIFICRKFLQKQWQANEISWFFRLNQKIQQQRTYFMHKFFSPIKQCQICQPLKWKMNTHKIQTNLEISLLFFCGSWPFFDFFNRNKTYAFQLNRKKKNSCKIFFIEF